MADFSICDEFSQSRYVSFLSGYVGVHKSVSGEEVLNIDLVTIPTNEPLY